MKADIPPATARRPAPGAKPRVTRRRVLTGAAGLFGLSAGTAVYAAAIEPDGLVVTRYAPALPGWPAGRKLSITVIADLHAGGPDMQLEHIRRIVDRASALKSDIVLLLGDFIASYRFAFTKVSDPVWAAELARLKAPLGTWAILGNHDWWHDLHGVRACACRREDSDAWKTMPSCSARPGSASGSPASATNWPFRSATAAIAASTICR